METVVHPPAEPDLHLLTDWSETGRRQRTRTAAIGSAIAHVAIIAVIVIIPAPPPHAVEVHRTVTPLVEPLTELTQKAPNTAKVTKEFSAADLAPRPRVQAPPSPPPSPAPTAPRAAPFVPPPTPKAAQNTPLPEPPKLEARAAPAPKIDLPQAQAPPPPPPQIQPEEKKSPFENIPGAATGVPAARSQVPIPGSPIEDAVRRAARNSAPGGVVVGDQSGGIGGSGGGLNVPGSPGARGSNIQLLSNPQGIDFRPYLTQILGAVRRNWMAVMPESVRLGRRGQVAIQFSVARDGKVPKLVIATSSGADVLDRAAIAGISASTPFPPLPAEFKGDTIVLQFNFSYNMPRQ